MKRYAEILRDECPGFAAFLAHEPATAATDVTGTTYRIDRETGLPSSTGALNVLVDCLCEATGAKRSWMDVRRVGATDYEKGRTVYVPIVLTPCRQGPEHEGFAKLRDACAVVRRVAANAFPPLRDALAEGMQKHERRVWRSAPPEAPEPMIKRLKRLSLDPASFRYSRALGVEIEGFNSLSREQMEDALPFWARAVSDGSIRPAAGTQSHEVRALLPRDAAEPRLFALCKKLAAVGFRVNSSCGLHVHFDMRGRTGEEVKSKARIAEAWLHALQELLPASRRGNEYCKWGISQNDRYRAVNLRAFQAHQTLEIRCHSGTCDYTKILAWVRLCELILALRRKPKAGSCVAVLDQLPLAEHDRSYWLARHRALNPTQYSANGSAETETA
jgi:hypothetical protein